MNKYELRTNNKKSAIMEATLTLINEKGFTASSIQQIASLAKVSPVSIYNYYGSKEKLVLECIKLIILILQEVFWNRILLMKINW